MSCVLVSLEGSTGCNTSDGGIYCTYLIDLNNIASIVFDTTPLSATYGCITDIITTGTSQVFKYIYDDDDSASYNQTGTRQNKKHTSAQQAFMKFGGISKEYVSFANGAKGCCKLLALHCTNDGPIMAQGVDFDANTDLWKVSKQTAKATFSLLTDTGAGEGRLEVTIDSVGRCLSPLVDMTEVEIEAISDV